MWSSTRAQHKLFPPQPAAAAEALEELTQATQPRHSDMPACAYHIDEAIVPYPDRCQVPGRYTMFGPTTLVFVKTSRHEKPAPPPAPPSDPRTYAELMCAPHRSLFPDPPFLGTGNPKEDREGFHLQLNLSCTRLFKYYPRSRADAMVVEERAIQFLKRKRPEGSPQVAKYVGHVASFLPLFAVDHNDQ